jgi:Rrf2 family protein
LQALSRKQVISSQKGLNGGFFLDVNQKRKPIKEIVEAIDGGNVFTGCGLGLRECSESQPCPLHDQFKKIRANLTDMMANTTIEELAAKLQRGETVLSHS